MDSKEPRGRYCGRKTASCGNVKVSRAVQIFVLNLIAVVLLVLAADAMAADANSIRLAVIPFSAPQKNPSLQLAAAQLPDFLMVELSRENKFQLVEREKVNAIWSELHLAEDGYVSAQTAAQLGHILSCDWLVGGSIVQIGTNNQVWIKVIDVQSGVVLDLKTFPFNSTNFPATVSPIPAFLAQVDPDAKPRQFIALGKFADQSLSSTHGDWSQRLPALIEKHFMDAGYGVVEREAVAPIFSEFQFESAGLTGDYTNRVKLKPAFWLVDGGYKWVYDTQEKWSIALRVQKIGGAVQIFRFTVKPGELENSVVSSIESAMTNTPAMNPEQAATAESKAREDIAMKYAAGHDEFANGNIAQNREDTLDGFKQAILLNPNNWHAKYMLGLGLFETVDPEQIRQGRDLLNEVVASKDPKYSIMASNLLDDFAKGRLTVSPGPIPGMQDIVPHGQPLSWPKIPTSPSAELQARIAKMNEITNIVPRAESVVQIPPPMYSGYYEWITAIKYYRGELFIACRTTLYKYDTASQSTVEIKLPVPFNHPIIALEADDNNLWLGSDGDGLVQISRSGDLVRRYGENDGFPSASVTSLQMEAGRLLVGFSNHDSGYIDLGPGKFTGHMSDISLFKPGNQMQDDALPPTPGTNSNFMATTVPMRCVAICRPHGTNWDCINVSTNFSDDSTYCCQTDDTQPNLLWVGNGNATITLIDMDKLKVVGESHLMYDDSWVQWMFNNGDNMIVISSGKFSNTYNLYSFKKSALTGASPGSVAAGQSSTPAPPRQSTSAPNPEDADWPFDFLKQNYSKFVTVHFQKDENGLAVLQRLNVHDHMFMYGDDLFFGIKFTVPAWLDGDFKWIYAPIKTEKNKYFASSGDDLEGIVMEDSAGDGGIDTLDVDDLTHYPHLHELLPYSHSVQIQTVRQDRLEPGKTCAIWFDVNEKDYPDELFAITINSKHGEDTCGTLPLVAGPTVPERITTSNPPRSPEELRARFEAALKSKDEATALSLVYWEGSSGPNVENLQPSEFSKYDVGGEIDNCLDQHIGSVTLRPWPYPFGMTNVVDGIAYGPNIPGVGILQVASASRQWVEYMLYARHGDNYFIPVGIKEPDSAK